MIKKIKTIRNLATFKNFNWDDSVKNKENSIIEFNKLNIIYGRNYSGKTSVSRVLRMLEIKEKYEKYPDVGFVIETESDRVTQNEIEENDLNIRVYNEDFIKDNLSFLINEDEKIKSFAVLGKENVKIEKEIISKEEELEKDDGENKIGLKIELEKNSKNLDNETNKLKEKEKSLKDKLTEKAKNIKENTAFFGDVNYNITKIKNDITTLIGKNKNKPIIPLTEQEKQTKKESIQEESKKNLNSINNINLDLDQNLEQVNTILIKEIKPTKTIQELLDDALLQNWVKQGIGFHKRKKENCAFCGNKIPEDLWQKLDNHFTKESEDLIKNIEIKIQALNNLKIGNDFLSIEEGNFYSNLKKEFDTLKGVFDILVDENNNNIDVLIENLENRKKDIFKKIEKIEIENKEEEINNVIAEINKQIKLNNEKTQKLEKEKNEEKENLRLDEVFNFFKTINYEKIDERKRDIKKTDKNKGEIESKIRKVETEIGNLKIQLKDESVGAEKVNEFLNNFFGKEELKFEPTENDLEDETIKFEIKRNGEIANNLSEGEKSLIAFCYFVAKLQEVGNENKDLIVWIDDPISSLDNNHIFFIFSLIECEIAQKMKQGNYNFKQLFISTHNLDFLKYLKRMNGVDKEKTSHFIVCRNKHTSDLKPMPKYLKKYITEFHYLFEQIYKCSVVDCDTENHDCFYNFGNNLRKFLEAYLFYKYPDTSRTPEKIKKFFGEDEHVVPINNRINNEFSHLAEIFDRSMKPIEIPEIPKLAKFVLEKIEEKDGEQYNCLLNSTQQ